MDCEALAKLCPKRLTGLPASIGKLLLAASRVVNLVGPEFILKSPKYPLHHRPYFVSLSLGGTELRLRFHEQKRLRFALAASVRVDDWLVVTAYTGLPNR